MFYKQKSLQKGAKPNDFFKEIAHTINLEGKKRLVNKFLDLYKVRDIRFYTSNYNLCPVVVEIKNQVLRE